MTSGQRVGKQVLEIGTTEARQIVFDFTGSMENGHTLSSISSTDSYGVTRGVSEASGELTISGAAINTGGAITADGETVATSKGVSVLVRASGGTVGRTYEVVCTATTSNGDTITLVAKVMVT